MAPAGAPRDAEAGRWLAPPRVGVRLRWLRWLDGAVSPARDAEEAGR